MATMYANNTLAVQQKINLAAYEDLDSAGHDDDRSTRASSGGSEPVSSGSEDERDLKTHGFLGTLRCDRRVPACCAVAPRSHCAAAVPVLASEQQHRSTPTVTQLPSRAQRPQKKRLPAGDLIQRKIDSDLSGGNAMPAAGFKKQAVVPINGLLSFPPGLEPVACASKRAPGLEPEFSAPPGLEHPSKSFAELAQGLRITAVEVAPYSRKTFRKEMVAIFNDIRQARTASLTSAVHIVRTQNVPKEEQPSLFSEMMTRAVEEMSGPGRRLCMAFVTGIAAGSPSAFAKEACLAGIKIFFDEVYDDLMDEIPKLPTRVEREFLPVLRQAFIVRELNEVLPARLRVAP